MKKLLAILFVIIAIRTMSYGLWAVENNKDIEFNKEHYAESSSGFGDFWTKELILTTEQSSSIQKINLKYQKELVPIEANIKKLKIGQRELLLNKDIDEQKWLDLIDQIAKNESIIKQKTADEKLETLKVLT